MGYEENKQLECKFYQRTWFLIVAGIAIFIAGFVAGTPGYYEAEEVTQQTDEQEDIDSETQKQEAAPVPVDLTTGTWVCGVDFEPGRYVATPVDGSGTITINEGTLHSESEWIGTEDGDVPSYTFTVEEGDTISIEYIPAVHLEPLHDGESAADVIEEDAEVEKQTPIPVDLTTGTWTCGVDIAPGRYVATPKGGAGTLTIVGENTTNTDVLNDGSYDGFYNLNGEEVHGVPSVTCTIEEGDTIVIDVLESVHFEPIE